MNVIQPKGHISRHFDELLREYARTDDVVVANFRQVTGITSGCDRATHLLHPYPAKLLLAIPYYFLSAEQLIKPNGTVGDPFCGSGTTIVESLCFGHDSIAADANPYARMLTKVKTTPLNYSTLEKNLTKIASDDGTLVRTHPDLEYWYEPKIKRELSRLLSVVRRYTRSPQRDFFELCFAVTARKLSNADPHLCVPVRLPRALSDCRSEGRRRSLKENQKLKRVGCRHVFNEICRKNISRMRRYAAEKPNSSRLSQIYDDARQFEPNTVDLIITSPPYPGAQKYARSVSLEMKWLGLMDGARQIDLERLSIGREHFRKSEFLDLKTTSIESADAVLREIYDDNRTRACIGATYLIEMADAITAAHKSLTTGGYMVQVVADNHLCGRVFRTSEYLCDIAQRSGFELLLSAQDRIHSRALMTKRNGGAPVIDHEHILLFQKR